MSSVHWFQMITRIFLQKILTEVVMKQAKCQELQALGKDVQTKTKGQAPKQGSELPAEVKQIKDRAEQELKELHESATQRNKLLEEYNELSCMISGAQQKLSSAPPPCDWFVYIPAEPKICTVLPTMIL